MQTMKPEVGKAESIALECLITMHLIYLRYSRIHCTIVYNASIALSMYPTHDFSASNRGGGQLDLWRYLP